jgi:hypothetical protein
MTNNKLIEDFFKIMFSKDYFKQDEAYHRVINSGFKILKVVHENLNGSFRNQQNHNAMILFQMSMSKGLAIRNLIKGYSYENFETKQISNPIIDPTTIAALTRTQFEAFSSFYNIFNSNKNQDVVQFLHDIWMLAGLKERQKINIPKDSNRIRQSEKEKVDIEKLIESIKNNPIFLMQTEENKNKILKWLSKGKFELVCNEYEVSLLSQKDLFLNSGVNEAFSDLYRFLSWFIHPSFISVLQFSQMFEMEYNVEHSYSIAKTSRIIMSMFIVEYCQYFEVAMKEFQKLPKIDQLIIYFDNKSYRNNHDFHVDSLNDLFDEFNLNLMKNEFTKHDNKNK